MPIFVHHNNGSRRHIFQSTYSQIMSEQRKGLPENAQRELKPGEVYEPLLGADRKWAEITPYSVTVGLLMVVIFSAAAAYLGLRVGPVSYTHLRAHET